MKHIKLQVESVVDKQQIINLLNKYNIKLINGFYLVDNKDFKQIKVEIKKTYPNLSIRANSEYVIIKRKGVRVVSTKYVTHKEFDDFKKEMYEFKETTNNNFKIIFRQLDVILKHLGIKQPKPKKK